MLLEVRCVCYGLVILCVGSGGGARGCGELGERASMVLVFCRIGGGRGEKGGGCREFILVCKYIRFHRKHTRTCTTLLPVGVERMAGAVPRRLFLAVFLADLAVTIPRYGGGCFDRILPENG